MKQVLRKSNTFQITHIFNHVSNGKAIYLVKEDYDTVNYDITSEHISKYLNGFDENLRDLIIYNLAMGDLSLEAFRYNVANSNHLIKNVSIIEKL